MFPITLSLEGRACLVVGAGAVATRKVHALVEEGARVTVVAPLCEPEIETLAEGGRLVLERRPYRPGESQGYALVMAATNDRSVNRQVFEDADRAGIWVNVADDPDLCSFHLPARVQRRPLELTIASGGGAPFVSRRLRQLLERRFGPEWGEWAEAAARFRQEVRKSGLPPALREVCFERFFGETVDAERLVARVPTAPERSAWIAAATVGQVTDPGRVAVPSEPAAPTAGLVSLVGSGPGCAGLLTLRGRQRLLEADVVVYDRLAAAALPCDLPASVELRPVGKEAGTHPMPQEEINALLLRLSRAGRRVVRFKGGDPYVFGRGGEEAEALAAEGLPFEVVPGVTAATGAAAFVGIPVTHRREAVRLTLVTAHESIKEQGPQVRWDLLAQDPHATLVGYMGLSALDGIVTRLLAAGLSPTTPAAMVESATTSAQRVVRAELSRLPEEVRRAGLRPPALFVIGPTGDHAERLDWFARRPLADQRLVVPEPAAPLAAGLEAAGAEVLRVSLPVRPAARVAMGALPLTGCVLSRPVEVELLDDERAAARWRGAPVAYCRGPEVAEHARRVRWPAVEELEKDADVPRLVARIVARAHRGG